MREILTWFFLQNMKFYISLVVKASGPKTMKEFTFHEVPSHAKLGVDVGRDDIIQNFLPTEEVAMNGDTPWRGPREHSREFMQMLVEAITELGDVVVDYTVATGISQFHFNFLTL